MSVCAWNPTTQIHDLWTTKCKLCVLLKKNTTEQTSSLKLLSMHELFFLYAVTDFHMIAFQNNFPQCHTSLRYERPYLLNISALTEHYKPRQSLLLLLIKNSTSLISPRLVAQPVRSGVEWTVTTVCVVFADCERWQACQRLPLHHGKFGEWKCFPFSSPFSFLKNISSTHILLLFLPPSVAFLIFFLFTMLNLIHIPGCDASDKTEQAWDWLTRASRGTSVYRISLITVQLEYCSSSLPLSFVNCNRVLRTSIWSVSCMAGQTWQAFSWWTSAIPWWLNSCSAGTSWTRESTLAPTSLPR